MSSEEGATLLLRRARRWSDSFSGKREAQKAPPDGLTSPEVVGLVKLLEGLPLALDQAGAYIEETGCSVADYLHRYYDQRQLVLARRGTHGGAHPDSVTTTVRLSVEQVERANPAAVELLRTCAFLHPEAIPKELFVDGASHLGSLLGPVATDPYQFDLALAALRSTSLVARHPESQTLSVHRLVQAVLQDLMEPAEAHLWRERVVRTSSTQPFPSHSLTPGLGVSGFWHRRSSVS